MHWRLNFGSKISMKKYLFFAMLAGMAACNSATTTNETADSLSLNDSATMHIQVPNMQCFKSIKGSDTVYLKLEKFPNVVTGSLVYDFHEKDGYTGSIDGVLKGDTLVADYTFMSEGQRSVRQVAFLLTDSMVTEGYAAMADENGKMVFKNTTLLDFTKGLQLKAIPCPVE